MIVLLMERNYALSENRKRREHMAQLMEWKYELSESRRWWEHAALPDN